MAGYIGTPTACLFIYFLLACIMCGTFSLNNPDTFISERVPQTYCWAVPY